MVVRLIMNAEGLRLLSKLSWMRTTCRSRGQAFAMDAPASDDPPLAPPTMISAHSTAVSLSCDAPSRKRSCSIDTASEASLQGPITRARLSSSSDKQHVCAILAATSAEKSQYGAAMIASETELAETQQDQSSTTLNASRASSGCSEIGGHSDASAFCIAALPDEGGSGSAAATLFLSPMQGIEFLTEGNDDEGSEVQHYVPAASSSISTVEPQPATSQCDPSLPSTVFDHESSNLDNLPRLTTPDLVDSSGSAASFELSSTPLDSQDDIVDIVEDGGAESDSSTLSDLDDSQKALSDSPSPTPAPVLSISMIESLATDELVSTSDMNLSPSTEEYVIQSLDCKYFKYCARASKCPSCCANHAGHICSWVGRRAFLVGKDGAVGPETKLVSKSLDALDDVPQYPTAFNEELTKEHAGFLRRIAAQYLVPTLRREYKHATEVGAVRWRLELRVRGMCDGCYHSFLSGSWICECCTREYCFECRDLLIKDEHLLPNKRDRSASRRLRCRLGTEHRITNLQPVIRIDRDELARMIAEMEQVPVCPLPRTRMLSQQATEAYYQPATSEQHRAYLQVPLEHIDPRPASSSSSSSSSSSPRSAFSTETDAASNTPPRMTSAATALFQELWSLGEPIVVSIAPPSSSFPSSSSAPISPRLKLAWTPQMFIDRFGTDPCTIVDNRTQEESQSTVGSFFQRFLPLHDDAKDSGESYKIKDWPANTDFQHAFPELYEDFMSALPLGCLTRRDGVLNIAAHAAVDSNPPDLGPKGYFSDLSSDELGGNGSTRLHMDVADAVNMMMWSSKDEKTGEAGVAAWDLFRAEDSPLIRQFLYEQQAASSGLSLSKVMQTQDDPIHAQGTYLSAQLLAQLHAQHGVRSFRILQKPGDCIFIPAGCAHQVCNYAKCAKVAVDFVSAENVQRCAAVTEEFRDQTKTGRLWRHDVLELKRSLLFCWNSCGRSFP